MPKHSANSEVPKLLLTVEEACETLRISHWSLYRLIWNNQLETIKIGRRRLVPVAAIEKLVKEQTERSQ